MTASPRRGRKLLALALASTTVVIAGSTQMANASTKSTTTSVYSSSADSSALQLVITLPAALATVTGALLPNPIDLSLIRTSGQSTHDGKNADVATSSSDLAQGSLIDSSALATLLQPLLKHTVTSSLSDTSPAPYSVLSLPSNPLGLNLSVGPLTANTSSSSRSATSSGGVTSGALGSLATLAPSLVAPLSSTFDQVNAGLTTATTTLSSAIASGANALAPVTSLLSSLPSLTIPVSSILPGAQDITLSPAQLNATALTNVITALPTLLASVEKDLLQGSVLSLKGVLTSAGLSPLGVGTTSTGDANTGDISLFGGLLQVTASKASATASAPGVAGKAAAAATATLVKVQLGDNANELLELVAAEKGITTTLLNGVGGQTLDATLQPVITDINAGLNTALSTLTTLLQSLNSDAKILTQGTVTQSASADGTHAEAHAAPAQVVLGLPGAANLVAMSLGKVDVVANQANTTTTTTTTAVKPPVNIPVLTSKPVAPTKKLAYTGADLPLTAGAALLLLGTAAAVTRRRRTHSSEQ